MSEKEKYITSKGDIVWIDFDSSSRQEIKKCRHGLIVSRYDFNRRARFAIICQITSTIKDLPTRYSLPNEVDINGQVIISQLKIFVFQFSESSTCRSLSFSRYGKNSSNYCLYILILPSL